MIETVEQSDDDEGDLVEEAKPKAKKKGKNSPAATRKERSATPDVSNWSDCDCFTIMQVFKYGSINGEV